MNIIYTILIAFALGFFVRQRVAACALYLAGGAFVFAFQSVNLLLEWVAGSQSAFGGPYPDYESSKFVGYGLVNLIITLCGIGLVMIGVKLGDQRAKRQDTPSHASGAAVGS